MWKRSEHNSIPTKRSQPLSRGWLFFCDPKNAAENGRGLCNNRQNRSGGMTMIQRSNDNNRRKRYRRGCSPTFPQFSAAPPWTRTDCGAVLGRQPGTTPPAAAVPPCSFHVCEQPVCSCQENMTRMPVCRNLRLWSCVQSFLLL